MAQIFSKPDDHNEVKILKLVVFRTDFLVNQKLLSVRQLALKKVERKKGKFFVPAGRLSIDRNVTCGEP